MTARTRLLILSLSLIGLGFAVWSSVVHYRLLTQPNYVSPCDINAVFNCSELYLSPYGSIAGVSVALLGCLFFLVVGLIAVFSQTTSSKEQPATTYVFALSTVGLAMVLYLAYASYFVLQRWCPLCIGTYVAVIGLFIVSGASSSFPVASLPGRLGADVSDLFRKPAKLFATLSALVLAVSIVGCFPREGGEQAAGAGGGTMTGGTAAGGTAKASDGSFESVWEAQPRVDLGIPADGAKVIVVKFNDYQCPSCKQSHYDYKTTLDKYAREQPGVVKYVVKDYPLSSKCNFRVNGLGHAAACEASAAVRLAEEKGQKDQMIEWLFANQATLTPQSVEAQVRTALGISDFTTQYARVLPDIKRDVADGATLDIMYTPTYYVNGVKAQTPNGGYLNAQYIDQAIAYEITRASGKK